MEAHRTPKYIITAHAILSLPVQLYTPYAHEYSVYFASKKMYRRVSVSIRFRAGDEKFQYFIAIAIVFQWIPVLASSLTLQVLHAN